MHKLSWTAVQASPELGGLGILGLGGLTECFQGALVGRLFQDVYLKKIFLGWVSNNAGTRVEDARLIDWSSVRNDCWVVNGLRMQSLWGGGYDTVIVDSLPSPLTEFPILHAFQFADLRPLIKRSRVKSLGEARAYSPETSVNFSRWKLLNNLPKEWTTEDTRDGCPIPLRVSPHEINLGVRAAKHIAMVSFGDVVASKWGDVSRDRSILFLKDLRRSSPSLYDFQQAFGSQRYTLGAQLKHFLLGYTGVCQLCESGEADYIHSFFGCRKVSKLWKEWREDAPSTWTPALRDWFGFPEERYSQISGTCRKIVLQWLIRAVEIRRSCFFSYVGSLGGEAVKIRVYHRVEARLSFTPRPRCIQPQLSPKPINKPLRVCKPVPLPVGRVIGAGLCGGVIGGLGKGWLVRKLKWGVFRVKDTTVRVDVDVVHGTCSCREYRLGKGRVGEEGCKHLNYFFYKGRDTKRGSSSGFRVGSPALVPITLPELVACNSKVGSNPATTLTLNSNSNSSSRPLIPAGVPSVARVIDDEISQLHDELMNREDSPPDQGGGRGGIGNWH
jgi:hypothetical protein